MALGELESDIINFNATISACGKHRKWEKALQLFGATVDGQLEIDTITFNAADLRRKMLGAPNPVVSMDPA